MSDETKTLSLIADLFGDTPRAIDLAAFWRVVDALPPTRRRVSPALAIHGRYTPAGDVAATFTALGAQWGGCSPAMARGYVARARLMLRHPDRLKLYAGPPAAAPLSSADAAQTPTADTRLSSVVADQLKAVRCAHPQARIVVTADPRNFPPGDWPGVEFVAGHLPLAVGFVIEVPTATM